MAFVHGRATDFQIDNSAGSLTDLSSFVGNVDFSRDLDTPETTVFGNAGDRSYVAGLRGATISITGFWDPTTTTGPDFILSGILGDAASKSFQYGPQGTTTGQIRYTGECFLTSYGTSSPVDGVVGFTADFQITGAVTRAAI